MLRVHHRTDTKMLSIIQRYNALQDKLERAHQEGASAAFIDLLEREIEAVEPNKWSW